MNSARSTTNDHGSVIISGRGPGLAARGSADVEQVDHEDEGLSGADDRAGAAVAVTEVRRDDQAATAADLHADDAAVPAGDDVAGTEGEREALAAVPGRVEFLAAGVRDADVMHDGRAAMGRLGTAADGEVGDLEVA